MAAAQRVRGQAIPSPRLTGWGVACIVLYLGAPLLVGLVVLDGLLYLLFTRVLGRCYGIFCLLG